MFPLLLVSLSRGFSSSGCGKLLNNRSSEAVGRLWHLSPITVEPPFPCHRPDQPVSHIYDPLSVVTSVEHVSCCLTLTKMLRIPHLNQPSGQSLQDSAVFCSLLLQNVIFFGGCLVLAFFLCFIVVVELNELCEAYFASQGYSSRKKHNVLLLSLTKTEESFTI